MFVGPSGCGKTTSMRMINRMIDPTSGTLTVNGEDVTKVDPVKLRLGIGYVIQSAGPDATPAGGRQRRDRAGAAGRIPAQPHAKPRSAVMERVGLDPKLANRYPAQLSGGQQQRVGVARALAADPPILLMDEPFGAVDPVVREELQTEILRLQSELHKTIVFVTHDIDEAIKLGDKVAVFGRGGVLQQYDEPARLLVEPRQRPRRGLRRRRPRLPRTAVLPRDRAAAARRREQSAEADIDALRSGRRSGRWSSADGTPFAWINAEGVDLHRKGSSLYDSTIGGGSLFRPERHAAAGAGRGAVLADGARGGSRRRRSGDRRGARPTTCSLPGRAAAGPGRSG